MSVCPLIIPVVESSQVGEARRAATQMAAELGFDATVQGEVAIAATEAANNLVKHAQKGEIVLQAAQQPVAELEIIAIDSGPGIANLDQCLRDGYSTAGTRGEGLGAIQRLSDAFEMYSGADGTVILARFWNAASGIRTLPSSGGICVPYP
ncbi:MAG TPA: anti-sigma regulatory factor, partial [Burkholderiaceae bacterium]|nr:anti-sigma regulatory factor [Burkholderiaceae bacterium]